LDNAVTAESSVPLEREPRFLKSSVTLRLIML
jgi:hypothetical protein